MRAEGILRRADVPLDERGMRQAGRLARRLFAHGARASERNSSRNGRWD
jgi:broad specificity phosphatase PhoE